MPFNPGQANQENDAAYLVDATRTGGAGVDAIWPSPSANKSLYQACGGVYALMQMMANKGFTCSDSNFATLASVLANILTTADVQSGLQTVSWASTLLFNAARYDGFQVTLTGDVSVSVTGQTVGQLIGLLWLQDSVGGRTVTFPGNIKGAAQPDPAANVLSAQLFKVDASGNLAAVGPAASVNGLGGVAVGAFGAAPGNFSTLRVAGAAPAGLVLTGNGTDYVPTTAPGYTSGSNANGYWQKDPNGLIRQWGFFSGAVSESAVTFPVPFTSLGSVSVNATSSTPFGSGIAFISINNGSITLTEFEVLCGGDESTQNLYWSAIGY